tara:strand:- start:338 stop:1042 length:705 start_codon:yes stop_codon:yes gene_type:complete
MIEKNILCTICARKGSKGLKNKNFLNLLGKPLIVHTIDQAKKVKLLTKIVVSTNSKKMIDISKNKIDYCIKRPEKLSNDHSSKVDVIKHALIEAEKKFKLKFNTIIDLDITSPLRSSIDIEKALKIFLKKRYGNLVSGSIARKNPFFNQVMYRGRYLDLVCNSKKKIVRRQNAPIIYDLNASIYIWRRKNLMQSKKLITRKTTLFKMPYIKSIDIDDQYDFNIVKFILKKKLNK